MAETVTVASDGSHIRVQASGPPSLAELQRTLARIAEIRRERGIDRIFVDSRERSGQPALAEIVAGGRMLAERLGNSARVAVLVHAIEDGHTFFRITAAGSGAQVAYFVDEQRALAWLDDPD
jgi:hypothetical protein